MCTGPYVDPFILRCAAENIVGVPFCRVTFTCPGTTSPMYPCIWSIFSSVSGAVKVLAEPIPVLNEEEFKVFFDGAEGVLGIGFTVVEGRLEIGAATFASTFGLEIAPFAEAFAGARDFAAGFTAFARFAVGRGLTWTSSADSDPELSSSESDDTTFRLDFELVFDIALPM